MSNPGSPISEIHTEFLKIFIIENLPGSFMKKIWCLAILAICLTIGFCAAEVPNLIGNWTGSYSEYTIGEGFSNSAENESFNFTFVEQKDRIFAGNLIDKLDNGTRAVKVFTGAIGLDNKTLYIAEFKGYTQGTIISNDEIELIHLENGENGSVAIDRLHKIKT